jgi:hypothetical protein
MLQIKNDLPHVKQVLPKEIWKNEQQIHQEKISLLLDPYLEKRSRHEKDPVLDFLFEYYKFRPSHLMRWSPGLTSALEFSDFDSLPQHSEFSMNKNIAYLNPDFFPKKRIRSVKWMLGLLKKSRSQKPLFGCFGMHEWAMVYRAEEIRHEQVPLRLPMDEINKFVESRPLVCTHFDAFRFFTEDAQPMNKNHLSRETFQDTEQPGCIHTNMDLYKWAYKLTPWISGNLLRDAFLNAVNARKIDMQASPYDARKFGLEPIKIETNEGRKKYIHLQTDIYERSIPIRVQLIDEYENVLKTVDSD